jgi:hypothetical protein
MIQKVYLSSYFGIATRVLFFFIGSKLYLHKRNQEFLALTVFLQPVGKAKIIMHLVLLEDAETRYAWSFLLFGVL